MTNDKKDYSKRLFLIMNVILLLALGIVLLRQYQINTKAKATEQVYRDSIAYLEMLARAGEMLLDNNSDGAIEWYYLAEQSSRDSAQWGSRAVKYLDLQTSLMLYADSLQRNQTRLQNVIMQNRRYINSLRQEVEAQSQQADTLDRRLAEAISNIDKMLFNNEELQTEVASLSEQLDVYQEQIMAFQHSYGSLSFTIDNKKVSYFGQLADGMASGYGIGIFDSKGIYEGEWQQNMRHGVGKYIWANGDFYEGNYVHGNREGFGIYTFATGEKYEGYWQNDLRDGAGVMLSKEGKKLLDGVWQADKFDRSKIRKDTSQR